MSQSTRAGDLLAGRYRLDDLLSESGEGRFWRAHDRILDRPVAVHVIAADDERADRLLHAARCSATVLDQRILRVLDAERVDGICYVVNEWGSGASLDVMLANLGPLAPRPAAWLVSEAAAAVAAAHATGVSHGRLVPENVMVDEAGSVRIIGLCVDAALQGLPADDPDHDLRDLAGLLHASLTGTWAGPSRSLVPSTPTEHDRPLRPRQVRAGVPRALDDVCDELLCSRRPRDPHPIETAHALAAALADFVGDPTGLGEAIAAGSAPARARSRSAVRRSPAATAPAAFAATETAGAEVSARATQALPEQPPTQAGRDSGEGSEQEPRQGPPGSPGESRQEPPAQAPAEEQPTEAGMPIFDDESDDVSWLARRTDPVPPPPPFEDPPERPLFAPDPPGGAGRPPRPGPRVENPDEAATGQLPVIGAGVGEYWPWQDDTGSGSGRIPAYQDSDAGRRWLRLAGIFAVVLLLVVAVAIAYNIGRGRGPLGGVEPEPTPSPTQRTTTPYRNLLVSDFDPQGEDGGVEDPEDVGAVLDGDPTTSWQTSGYFQQFGPNGLKTGVGLLVDLGAARPVSRVDVTLVGASTLEVYLAEREPETVEGLTPVGEVVGAGRRGVQLEEPVTGRYVVLWLTSLAPTDDGRFRGEIAEIAVRG